MIRRTASAVFLLRDGFSGKTLTDGPATYCLLDGRPLRRPIWKQDGYLVLTDLAPGEHTLQLIRNGYRDELVQLQVVEGRPVEDTIALKPGPGYRFPRDTVRLTLSLHRGGEAAADAQIWLGAAPRGRLKLAQEKAEIGDAEVHLFCDGNTALLPVPGHFLLADGKAPELVYLRSLRGETGEFASPLASAHGRGTELIPVQSYCADGVGTVQVLLREPGTLIGFFGGRIFEAQLAAGEQRAEWKLEG